ncbi:hypothetical protein EDEG_02206 [Edhazardia aedis USNM 41457]|uniref:Uncharacterized protein n=1 Tax=Edhazardia aedis (strain USNM 41457) TaxID=1003232 RepID=J9D6M5_EDHAE|nr:hypothetical protein EDEG_02206 [Edhazardia aedis USNM 41457]|eukprot:EJW03441.1 hypothetical protein EDEG_02206 [Edhazardia aedis USNM 41457]
MLYILSKIFLKEKIHDKRSKEIHKKNDERKRKIKLSAKNNCAVNSKFQKNGYITTKKPKTGHFVKNDSVIRFKLTPSKLRILKTNQKCDDTSNLRPEQILKTRKNTIDTNYAAEENTLSEYQHKKFRGYKITKKYDATLQKNDEKTVENNIELSLRDEKKESWIEIGQFKHNNIEKTSNVDNATYRCENNLVDKGVNTKKHETTLENSFFNEKGGENDLKDELLNSYIRNNSEENFQPGLDINEPITLQNETDNTGISSTNFMHDVIPSHELVAASFQNDRCNYAEIGAQNVFDNKNVNNLFFPEPKMINTCSSAITTSNAPELFSNTNFPHQNTFQNIYIPCSYTNSSFYEYKPAGFQSENNAYSWSFANGYNSQNLPVYSAASNVHTNTFQNLVNQNTNSYLSNKSNLIYPNFETDLCSQYKSKICDTSYPIKISKTFNHEKQVFEKQISADYNNQQILTCTDSSISSCKYLREKPTNQLMNPYISSINPIEDRKFNLTTSIDQLSSINSPYSQTKANNLTKKVILFLIPPKHEYDFNSKMKLYLDKISMFGEVMIAKQYRTNNTNFLTDYSIVHVKKQLYNKTEKPQNNQKLISYRIMPEKCSKTFNEEIIRCDAEIPNYFVIYESLYAKWSIPIKEYKDYVFEDIDLCNKSQNNKIKFEVIDELNDIFKKIVSKKDNFPYFNQDTVNNSEVKYNVPVDSGKNREICKKNDGDTLTYKNIGKKTM